MTAKTRQFSVTFPASDGDGSMSQDREWCRVRLDEEQRTIRFHDYAEIYAVPGLYEEIFHRHLDCRSPAEVVGLLAQELGREGQDPQTLSVLDVGAGNGLVGERLRAIGVRSLVGVDILEAAAAAAGRDRPGLYADYVACDLTQLSRHERERLCARRPSCLTTVAALGFDDMPPRAFAEAYNLVSDGGWVAFNIKADFLDEIDGTGFRRLIARMVEQGSFQETARRRYRHRFSVERQPLDYVALVGRKRGDAPVDSAG
jgi:SAM-dependent methyltransferase